MTPLAYLATPYTKYKPGIEAAFVEACKLTARLIRTGMPVYSPVAHCHPVALHGDIDPLDQTFWYDFNAAMLAACRVLIVAHMPGWEQSTGIALEIEFFAKRGRSVFDLDPATLAMARRR